VNFTIERGDRIALVGINGAGKSTLIKILAGAEPVTAGEYTLGHNAQPDYFAQDQYKELDAEARMIDDLGMVAPRANEQELRTILGCFLFGEDDVFKRIGVLSGGERNRYALARMLMMPSNFLLLDEPTNHLDLRAKDVLLTALLDFSGTLVFVSHDRYFIDRLATRVFEVADGVVTDYRGNYEDYLWKKAQPEVDSFRAATVRERSAETPRVEPKKRANPIKLRQMQRRQEEIEGTVARLESEITQMEGELATFKSAEETIRLSTALEARRRELKAVMAEWEEVAQAIEAL
jgi:ATP-binding cassette subfamily F protein 3